MKTLKRIIARKCTKNLTKEDKLEITITKIQTTLIGSKINSN